MKDAVQPKMPVGSVGQQPSDRQIMVQRLIVWRRLQEVHLHELRPPLHCREERERIRNMFDYVKCVCRAKAARHTVFEVVNRCAQAAAGKSPSKVFAARIIEVGELHGISSSEQHQTVRPYSAAVVEHAGSRRHTTHQLTQVWELGPGHREGGEVVEVRVRGPVEGRLIFARCKLSIEFGLIAPKALELEARPEVFGKLRLFASWIEVQILMQGRA